MFHKHKKRYTGQDLRSGNIHASSKIPIPTISTSYEGEKQGQLYLQNLQYLLHSVHFLHL